MKQNTAEWHKWRSQGIGASEAPIIMGLSPYKTAYELWEQKINPTEQEYAEPNFIQQKGHDLEPKARALYEIQTGNDIPPKLIERKDKPWCRASLDGFDEKNNRTAEIKYVGNGDKWEMAQKGLIPENYMAQMQWQFYVSGATSGDYIAFNGDEIIVIPVQADLLFIKEMVKQVEAFKVLVDSKTEPKLSARDWKEVKSSELRGLIEEYSILENQCKPMQKKLSELKDNILNHEKVNHPRMRCNGYTIITKSKAGSIDFKKIVDENLPEIDTSKYLKKSITYKELKSGTKSKGN